VLGSDCNWDYGERQVLRWPTQKGAIGNSERSRAERYERIIGQYQCALLQLDSLFDELKRLDIYEQATIIVHGDHGTGAFVHSPAVYNLERLTGLDLRESYSALFAVKYPGGEGRLIRETKSLNVLMAETAMRIAGKSAEELGIEVVEEPHPFVYLTNSEPFQSVRVDIYSDL
jgi:arylsulfatase A-like enzyme